MKRTDFKQASPAAPEKVKYKPNLTYDARALMEATDKQKRDYTRALQTCNNRIFCPCFDFDSGEIYALGEVHLPLNETIFLQTESERHRVTVKLTRLYLNVLHSFELFELLTPAAWLDKFKQDLRIGDISPDVNDIWWHKHINAHHKFTITSQLIDVWDFFENLNGYNYISEKDFYNQLNLTYNETY